MSGNITGAQQENGPLRLSRHYQGDDLIVILINPVLKQSVSCTGLLLLFQACFRVLFCLSGLFPSPVCLRRHVTLLAWRIWHEA